MATTPSRIISGSQLTTSAVTYVTAVNERIRLERITLCNTTGGAVTATVYLVPSGGAAGVTNIVISAKSIAPGETYKCPELIGHVLESGGTLQALASAGASITITGSGWRFT